MLMFDATSREVCTAKRETTTTPLQALVLLNDPQFVEAARMVAEKLVREKNENLDLTIAAATRRMLGRSPEAREIKILEQLYDEQLSFFKISAGAAEILLATGEHLRDTKLAKDEVAAMTVLVSTLMNHDEFVMKR
jgi:tetrahydromethanopterin S-methyltransferase subunit H